MSSKTARLHRRQVANRKRYARLRKAGRVPQHTQAERRLAAAERERQREADQKRHVRLRWETVPLLATVGAAAAIVTFTTAPALSGPRLYHPYSAAPQLYQYVPSHDSGSPDLPHLPETGGTLYATSYAAGTARTGIHIGPGTAATWLPWEWTNTNIFGD